MLFDFFVINHTFDEYRGKNAGCKARLFPRKKTRTNWICPDKFVRNDINRWLWEDYKAAGQASGQIQFVRVIFLGHKHSFVMAQTMTYAPENGELRGRKLWVVFVNTLRELVCYGEKWQLDAILSLVSCYYDIQTVVEMKKKIVIMMVPKLLLSIRQVLNCHQLVHLVLKCSMLSVLQLF